MTQLFFPGRGTGGTCATFQDSVNDKLLEATAYHWLKTSVQLYENSKQTRSERPARPLLFPSWNQRLSQSEQPARAWRCAVFHKSDRRCSWPLSVTQAFWVVSPLETMTSCSPALCSITKLLFWGWIPRWGCRLWRSNTNSYCTMVQGVLGAENLPRSVNLVNPTQSWTQISFCLFQNSSDYINHSGV